MEIHATLDPALQQAAVSSIEDTLDRSSDPSGAVASIEPQNEAKRALAVQKAAFNLALDARR